MKKSGVLLKHTGQAASLLSLLFLALAPVAGAQDKPLEMEKVVITAARHETPVSELPHSVTVITSEDIARQGVKTVDDALVQATGVQVRRSKGLCNTTGHTTVDMRGTGSTSRILILKNGVPLNSTYVGSVDLLNAMSVDDIERIEIIRGASSALYGSNAMGGVINIITRKPADGLTGSIRLEGGSLHTGIAEATLSGGTDNFGIRSAVGRKQTRGYEYLEGTDWKDYYETPEMELTTASIGGDVWLGDSMLSVDVDYYLEEWLDRYSSRIDGKNATTRCSVGYSLPAGDFILDFKAFHADAAYETEKRKFDKNTRTYGDLADSKYNYNSDVPKQETGLMMQASTDVGAQTITAGVDARVGDCDAEYTYRNGRRTFEGEQTQYSLFINDEIRVGDSLIISAGTRYDRWDNTDGESLDTTTGTPRRIVYPDSDKGAWSPRAGIVWNLDDDTKFRASYGRGFKAPSLYYLYRTGGHGSSKFDLANPDLGPEKMTGSYDIGFDTRATDNLSISFTAYQSRFQDFLTKKALDAAEVPAYYTPGPGQTVYQHVNVGKVGICGFEAELEYDFNDRWAFNASYNFNRSKIKEHDLTPEVEGNYLPYAPLHQTKLGVTYDNPDLINLGIFITNVSKRYADLANSEAKTIDAYQTMDVKVSRDLKGGFNVYASVDNVTNEKYKDSYSSYNPPRTVSGGVKYSF